MVKASSNGFELLNLMTLNGIKVDPVTQTVSSMEGGSVQVRINDIVASTQDIMAVRPDEVVRVEYIDNPGIRYSDSGLKAVINYVVKRRSAGYVAEQAHCRPLPQDSTTAALTLSITTKSRSLA